MLQEDLDLVGLAEDGIDGELLAEIGGRLGEREAALRQLELAAFFRHPDDGRDAILTVRCGAGGLDAMDWAERLERMYYRHLTRAGFEVEIVDRLAGENVGIHHSEMEVRGPYAFGTLRGEVGVHRVCHISEFDANGKKQTSFAAVDAIPVWPETAVAVDESDLETETFCSGGPGGQNVNKVATAVRIRHRPSGIVVKCQSQRSQIQNKRTAIELLVSRLKRLEEERRPRGGGRVEAAFGHQIRTYVLEPYQLVKDHRTGHERRDASRVLDGDLGGFTEAFLRKSVC